LISAFTGFNSATIVSKAGLPKSDSKALTNASSLSCYIFETRGLVGEKEEREKGEGDGR